MKLTRPQNRIFWITLVLALAGLVGAFWFLRGPFGTLPERGPNQGTTKIKKYNRLGEEKSPYLLQHKNNPVHWFPWGPEAFQAAREENKLIFLSVGYSTCYWCHVMEQDSFERNEVGAALNRDFISIKVDREERPDVDQIYMDAVVRMAGRGGWPMSVFLTPDLEPFYGGTFYRRRRFLNLLAKIQERWQANPKEISDSAKNIVEQIEPRAYSQSGNPIQDSTLRLAFKQLKKSFDPKDGGFGGAPKFPQSHKASYLLRIYQRTENQEALEMATQTLDQMARGGLYDHLGGGFHRYSTDQKWFAPHFEKMLYDNAQLAITYLEAYQVTRKPEYAAIARETLDYILKVMTDPQGGFYSAQDAGEVGREGEYYVWKESELNQALTPQEFKLIKNTYGVKTKGNFHQGENILFLSPRQDWSVKENPILKSAQTKLMNLRNQRTSPHLDDKILTAWNGLMIAAMAKGYQVLRDPRYQRAAEASAEFIQKNLVDSQGKLLRRYRDGEARFPAYLPDYAFLIYGLLQLYQADFNPKWIQWAIKLQKDQDQLFWDEATSGYFFAQEGDSSLIHRKKKTYDGAIPSGNSIAALNLLKLHDLILDPQYSERADQLFTYLSGTIRRYPAGYTQAMIAADYRLDRSKEIAVVPGTQREEVDPLITYINENFFPNQVIAVGEGIPFEDTQTQPGILRAKMALEGKTTIFVCEDNICKEPVHTLKDAKPFLEDIKKYNL